MGKNDKNDLKDSQMSRAELLAEQYQSIDETIRVHQNYKRTIGVELKDLLVLNDEKKVNGVKLVEKIQTKKITIRELKALFKGDDDEAILNNILVEVDIPQTVENMKYLNAMNETLAKKIGEKLEDLQLTKSLELEITGK